MNKCITCGAVKYPEEGTKYWYVDVDTSFGFGWNEFTVHSEKHGIRFDVGNYFTSQEDAEKMVEKVKALFKEEI